MANDDEMVVSLRSVMSGDSAAVFDRFITALETIVDQLDKLTAKFEKIMQSSKGFADATSEADSATSDLGDTLDRVSDSQDTAADSARRLNKTYDGMKSGLKTIQTHLLKFTGMLATARVGIQAFAVKAVDSARGILRISEVTGMTTEKIQRLQYAARSIGLDSNSLVNDYATFQAKALSAGSSFDKYLEYWLEQMKGMNEAQRRGVAQHLGVSEDFILAAVRLNKEGKSLADVMSEMPKSSLLDDDEIGKLDKFGKDWNKFVADLKTTGQKIFAGIMPDLEKFQGYLDSLLKKLQSPGFQEFVEGFMKGFSRAMDVAIGAIKLGVRLFQNLRELLKALGIDLKNGELAFYLVVGAVGALVAALGALFAIKTITGIMSIVTAVKTLTGTLGAAASAAGVTQSALIGMYIKSAAAAGILLLKLALIAAAIAAIIYAAKKMVDYHVETKNIENETKIREADNTASTIDMYAEARNKGMEATPELEEAANSLTRLQSSKIAGKREGESPRDFKARMKREEGEYNEAHARVMRESGEFLRNHNFGPRESQEPPARESQEAPPTDNTISRLDLSGLAEDINDSRGALALAELGSIDDGRQSHAIPPRQEFNQSIDNNNNINFYISGTQRPEAIARQVGQALTTTLPGITQGDLAAAAHSGGTK